MSWLWDVILQVQQRFAGLTKPGAWQKVISLHADAFWQRHGWKVIIGAAGKVDTTSKTVLVGSNVSTLSAKLICQLGLDAVLPVCTADTCE